MKHILLTKGQVAIVDDEDFAALSRWRWCAVWHKRREVWTAIRCIQRKGRTLRFTMSRVIMDAPAHLMVDHINGDTLDNRRCNLRLATNQQNQHNQTRLRKDNTTGYKGVSLGPVRVNSPRRFIAQIYFNKKRINLGGRKTALQAAKLYNKAARRLFGEYACLNKVA